MKLFDKDCVLVISKRDSQALGLTSKDRKTVET